MKGVLTIGEDFELTANNYRILPAKAYFLQEDIKTTVWKKRCSE
jgi:hypothetical protein